MLSFIKADLSVALNRVGSVAAFSESCLTDVGSIFILKGKSKVSSRKSRGLLDMSFPKEKPFNPQVSKVPILGPSSGNPASFQDPNSMASLGLRLQAATDQARADTLYDATVPVKKEGFSSGTEFRNAVYSPWILGTEACKKEGFSLNFTELGEIDYIPSRHSFIISCGLLGLLGLYGVYLSFRKHR